MIKNFIKKMIFKEKSSSKEYISFLRKKGIEIGNGCRIFDPLHTHIDTQNPKLLSIGNNVRITSGVSILTHDYSWSVLATKYNQCLGNIGTVSIGNNVFIGINSIILKNTIIGNNIIIGAGSIVSGKLEDNFVYAGNPAKKIMSIEEYYKKTQERQINDVSKIIKKFSSNNRLIEEKDLFEYFSLYTPKNKLTSKHIEQLNKTGNRDNILQNYQNIYNSFDEMIEQLLKGDIHE